MIMELGLSNCADTYVGSALIKGISGGERKRTSVGVELVVKPALVFLDGKPCSNSKFFPIHQLSLKSLLLFFQNPPVALIHSQHYK
jgi:ABC-type lipopolysaccharide export system ATPase subunit